jgi:hypothetical protein
MSDELRGSLQQSMPTEMPRYSTDDDQAFDGEQEL